MKKRIFWLLSVVVMALIAALALTLVTKVVGFIIPIGFETRSLMKFFFFLACVVIIGLDIIIDKLFFTEKFVNELKQRLDSGYTMRAAFRSTCNNFKIPEWLMTDQVIIKLRKKYLEEYIKSRPFP